MYVVKNFQNYYTLDMPGGTTTAPTFTMTVTESLASFPTTFPVLLEVWDTDPTFASTVEFMICTGTNVVAKQLTISTRGVDSTSIYDHINGAKVAINIAALNTNNMINNINQLMTDVAAAVTTTTFNTLLAQGNIPVTANIVSGEAYNATTTAGGITGPTLLFQSSSPQQWFKGGSTTSISKMAFAFTGDSSTGAAETHRVYLPGSIIPGWTGLTPGQNYYPSATLGGISTTPGDNWRQLLIAIDTTTAFFIDSGPSSYIFSALGTAGTTHANNGTSQSVSRADHEHKIPVQWTPIIQAPFTGQTSIWFANRTGLTYDIVSAYAVCNSTLGSSTTTIRFEKTTQSDIDGAASGWASIMTNNLTIDASERSSNTAAVAPSFATTTIAPNEHLRAYVVGAGTGVGDIQIFVVLKIKNTN